MIMAKWTDHESRFEYGMPGRLVEVAFDHEEPLRVYLHRDQFFAARLAEYLVARGLLTLDDVRAMLPSHVAIEEVPQSEQSKPSLMVVI